MKTIEPIKLPSVTWNWDDVTRLVNEFGIEGAIERITGTTFQRQYVEKMVDQVLMAEGHDFFKGKHIFSTGLYGEGTL